jgi:8-amino-7-oxononanoate synthase
VLFVCSPDYLGLSNHPAVIRAFQQVTARYGAGTVGSGIISGYTSAHQQVEGRSAAVVTPQLPSLSPLMDIFR